MIDGFETKRLSVRHWCVDLQDPARRLTLEQDLAGILTPKVLSQLPEPMRLSGDDKGVARWIDERAMESEVYSVSDAQIHALLGLMILAEGDKQSWHLGYLLSEQAWGRGYATELVLGLTQATPKGAGIAYLAGVDAGNPASSRVLLKAGFVLSPGHSDDETLFYSCAIP